MKTVAMGMALGLLARAAERRTFVLVLALAALGAALGGWALGIGSADGFFDGPH